MQKSEIAIIFTLIDKKREWVTTAKKQNISEPKSDQDEIKSKIKTSISHFCGNKIRENFLIITSLNIFYSTLPMLVVLSWWIIE